MGNLPESWTEEKLTDICKVYQPKTISTKEMIPYGEYPVFGANGQIGHYNKYNHEKPEILITCRGATCGTINRSLPRSWVNGNAMVSSPLDENLISKEFLYYYLKHLSFDPYITGSAQPQITRTSLDKLAVWFPNPSEQKRIVAKLEKLLAEVDTATVRLEKIPKIIKRFRQSVLMQAATGELTKDWREQNPDIESAEALLERIKQERINRYESECRIAKEQGSKKPRKPRFIDKSITLSKAELYEIPISWKWTAVDDFADVNIGSTPSRKIPEYWGNDINWVSSGEVANNFINSTAEKISILGFENSSTKIYPINTILIAMIGEGKTRGQTSILKIEAATNQNIAGLVFNELQVIPEYVWYWFLQRYEITRGGGRGGNQPALNGVKVGELPIVIPPVEEQQEIVKRVKALFDKADKIEESYKKAKFFTDKLTQSILNKAFKGELVPQDPTDEPTSALLKTIKENKAR